jgi:uncharacterized delta-60 repeat protein
VSFSLFVSLLHEESLAFPRFLANYSLLILLFFCMRYSCSFFVGGLAVCPSLQRRGFRRRLLVAFFGCVLFLTVNILIAHAQPGSLDVTFTQTGTGLNGIVYALAHQADGKVLVGGFFSDYNGTARNSIARLNADGTLDASFAPTGTGLNDIVWSIALQADGKILVGGGFTSYNGTTQNRIARLNTDGTLDNSFAPMGTGLNDAVYALTLQTDGKVLVGGFFTDYNGTIRNRILRLNADGTLDASFAPTGTGLNNLVLALALQADGKVIVGGFFTDYNGTTRNRIARLNADGTLDASFAPTGTGLNNIVRSLAFQADGKVLVGGDFSDYNGTARNRIARLSANGTLDVGFVPTGTGLSSTAFALALQADGKVLVGGSFTSFNGTAQNCIARLNTDGTLDASFAPTGTGLNSATFALALQADGKVLVGGQFSSYNGTARNRIARLNGTNPVAIPPPPPPPPVLTAPTISGGTFPGSIGIPFGAALNASGNPAPSVSLTSGTLPPGITLAGSNLTGIPTQEGTFTFILTATNSEGTATASVTVTIGPAVPLITSVSPASGTFGSTITISGYNLAGANAVSIGGIAVQSFSFVNGSLVAVVGAGGMGAVNVSTPLGSTSGGSFTFVLPEPPVLSGSTMATIQTGDENFSLFLAGRNIPAFASASLTPVSSTGAVVGVSLPIQIVSVSETGATLLAPVAARLVGTKRLTLRVADITSVSTTFAVVFAPPPMVRELTVSSTTASGAAFTTLVQGSGFFRYGFARVFVNGEESLYSSTLDANTVSVQIPAALNVRGGTARVRILNFDGQETSATVQIIGRNAPLITSVTPRWVDGNLLFVVRGVAFSPRITAVLGRRQVTVLPGGTDTEFEVAVPPDYEAPTFGTALLLVENPDGRRYGFLIGAPLFAPQTAFLVHGKNTSELASSTSTGLSARTSNGELLGQTSAFGLMLSPNPVSETLTLEVPAFAGVGRLSILNARGEEVLSGVIAGNERASVDVRSLVSGAYFVRVVGEGVRVVSRLTVVR